MSVLETTYFILSSLTCKWFFVGVEAEQANVKHWYDFISGWTTSIASTLGQKELIFIANQICFTVESVHFISGGVLGK